ncbi:MAG: type II secretion system F family protein, partial [Lentisphaerae bacterium]|nr:type II secretion system F family protein [Lentisphaerota bacterium]
MRKYTYRARNLAGRIVAGEIRAKDKDAAFEQLAQDKLVPIEIVPVAAREEDFVARWFGERIRDENIILLTRQLSAMLKAGIPILQTIEILRDQTENKTLKYILAGIARNISAGSRLSEAMAEYPQAFSPQYVSIVVTGESGGDLVQALSSIAHWMEREMEIRSSVKAALRYPLMVCVALVAAAVIMLTFVIPKFAAFFASSNVSLPLPTRILMGTSEVLQNHWPLLLSALIALGLGWFLLLRRKPVRLQYDRMKFRLRLLGPVYTKIAVARFGRILAMLIHNGVPVLRALEIAPTVVANTFFQEQLQKVRQFILDGNTVADGFLNEMTIFPPMVTSLIAVGEKTGSLDEMLGQVVDFYDAEIDYTLKHLTAMIEPIVTVIIGAGVLFLALSILLPIWNLSQALTSQ